MSRKRGRPARQYNIKVRAERRETIDYDALAQAVLEHHRLNTSKTQDLKVQDSTQMRKPGV